ncbi:pyridoxal-5'-phosphate-dependent protein [Candidatus Kaiserbacteria bacterium CG10_big_fil_rev_8_21_14_0_10_56_12]|uniref:Pyridoxal-5'-phosphate-dependent protein n=1 Tax=Candidatus Kaiserbacteria bacterium CG10_big_fil_rev_8_21_14_0_10_56_12 TaxID=1974611 RepID=A0A2H0UAK6_9BACT|nr:MAG: pyridoxal-5'-phosphate-dependent protein [Candidatus Kaiserbacteria bacterium CG10_big_fil_rev_8_21_14_0_10_56_12]
MRQKLNNKTKRKITFPRVYNIDRREQEAVAKVLATGPLSGFVGDASPDFLGGPVVKKFEKAFAQKCKVKHAVSYNSATTALHGAIVALGIGPGDEVIVPPYTMSASATAVLMNGAVPIFADIEADTFCLDPKAVAQKITKRTKAILMVNLFGQTGDMGGILALARSRKLAVIEDNAQSPLATWRGRYTGTVGDIGVFSFNVHKTMQAGEGGVLVTNNARYALRAQLCRNHGESVIGDLPHYTAGRLFGTNYRMTEVTAAIALVQLGKIDFLNKKRVALADRLTRKLSNISGLTVPHIPKENTHVYYSYVLKVDEKKLGMSRAAFVTALQVRGFPVGAGYVKPLYLLPLFQKRQAFNKTHFPFDYQGMTQDYRKGICPVTERMHYAELIGTDVCQYPYTNAHIDAFVDAVHEVLHASKKTT